MTYRQVDVAEAIRLREAGATVVDVREPIEWDGGHIAGAVHVPLREVPARIAAELTAHDAPVLVYCQSGARSSRVAEFLVAQGHTNVANLNARLGDWRAAGGAWDEAGAGLTPSQERRYARQLLMPDVGPDGQRRLFAARVLIIGAGGLGSPAALYLAAAGVGTIGIVDDDRVSESNLQRQVLHTTERVGVAKVDSAERAIAALNSEIRVVKHAERLDPSSAERLLGGYDVVVDGSDSIDTRYAINDAAVRLGKPVVHAAVYRWEAQVTTLVPFDGPCYRCLYPEPAPPDLAPACDVAGVIGVLPGLAGTLQASEVIKLVLGIGEPLVGRIVAIDLKRGSFEELTAARDPKCTACGVASLSAAGRG